MGPGPSLTSLGGGGNRVKYFLASQGSGRKEEKNERGQESQNSEKLTPGAEPAHSWGSAQWESAGWKQRPVPWISKVLGSADKIGGIQGRVHWVWAWLQRPGQTISQGKGLTWKTVKPELEQGLVWKNCQGTGCQEPIWVEVRGSKTESSGLGRRTPAHQPWLWLSLGGLSQAQCHPLVLDLLRDSSL